MPEVVDPAPAPVSGGGGSSSDTTTSSSGGSSVSNQNPYPGYIPQILIQPTDYYTFPASQDRKITNLFHVNVSLMGHFPRRFGRLKTVNFTLANAVNLQTDDIKPICLVEDKETKTITNFIDLGHVLKQDPKAKIEFEDTNFYVNDITNVFDQLDNDRDGITNQVFNLYDQFGRFPDPGGLQHHSNNIREGRTTLKGTIGSFAESVEFDELFRAKQNDLVYSQRFGGWTDREAYERTVNDIAFKCNLSRIDTSPVIFASDMYP